MAKILEGKIALVTGGARGIGRATVEKLAEAGATPVINYYNSSDEAEALAAQLAEKGVEAMTVQADVSDPSSVKEMMTAIGERFGQLDIVVSNAASGVLKPALDMKLKHWRWCLETNAFSINNLVQNARPLLKKGARVFALSSIGSIRAIPNYAFIGASKAALESLVRALSLELAPEGISVNTISAGVIDTDALKHFPNREQLLEEYRERNLAGRDLTPADVANVIYLLCLPEADMIRGQTIFVDAGYSTLG